MPLIKKDYCIIFIGPIAAEGEIPIGGYEAANRRTISNLKKNGINVIAVPYPIVRQSFVFKCIDYTFGFIKLILKVCNLLVNKDKEIICHITGLYKQFIYIELMIVILARIFCAKVVYEIRAGSMFWHYNRRTIVYKIIFQKVLKFSNIVGAQGKEYFNFIQGIKGKIPFYMPNYVENVSEFYFSELRNSELHNTKVINLIYFGRITLNKGIKKIIDIYEFMKGNSYSVTLTLIGIVSSDCVQTINELVSEHKDVVVINGLTQDKLFNILRLKHFFVFPTLHKGEGHSNALTEAMANGCVPICSDVGFNKSVVGDCGVVLPSNASAFDYVNAIKKIVSEGQWLFLSEKALSRVQEKFYAKKIVGDMIKMYETIAMD